MSETVKPKTLRIALDDVPFGDPNVRETRKVKEMPLPEGVSSKTMYKDVARLAWPSLLELTLTQLASMADMMMVGNLGDWAIASIGLTNQPKMMLCTVYQALNVGATAMVARYKGAGQREKAQEILRIALFINLILSVICGLIGFVFAEPLVAFMGAQETSTLVGGTQYLQIQMIGLPFLALTFTITGALRGAGNSRTAMIYNTLANAVNVLLNYALIEGHWGFPRMEVVGASLATIIGQTVACVYAFISVTRKSQYIHLDFRKSFLPKKEPVQAIVKVGLPSMLEQVAMRVGVIIFTRTIASLGTMQMATHQIAMNIHALTFMNGQAFSVSSTSLVGQSLGKRRSDMAVHYSKRTQQLGMLCSAVIALGCFFFGEQVVALYNDDPEIIRVGGQLLKMIALCQPIQASQFILSGALRGAGDTKYTARVIFYTVLLLRPILGILLVTKLGFGLYGAWITLITDQMVRSFLIFRRYNSGIWINALADHKTH